MEGDKLSELLGPGPPTEARSSALLRSYLGAIATIEDAKVQKKLLKELVRKYVLLERRVDTLLRNTLPEAVADEIKYTGHYRPRQVTCSILFSDIVGFTKLAETLDADTLVHTLEMMFTDFDHVVGSHRGTKIKTIGDAYMVVFGAPEDVDNHACDAIEAALEMLECVRGLTTKPPPRIRIGIHTGTVLAGVIGRDRMQFDVFGDDVNIASRFETSGEVNRINVSKETQRRAAKRFLFQHRGLIELKGKDSMEAYFVLGRR